MRRWRVVVPDADEACPLVRDRLPWVPVLARDGGTTVNDYHVQGYLLSGLVRFQEPTDHEHGKEFVRRLHDLMRTFGATRVDLWWDAVPPLLRAEDDESLVVLKHGPGGGFFDLRQASAQDEPRPDLGGDSGQPLGEG